MGLNERLAAIENKLEDNEKKKVKKFRIPFGKKVGKSQAKKNYVTIVKLNENNGLTFEKERIEEQTVVIDGVPRLATPEYVLNYKGNPFVILPSWSNKPISPRELYEHSMDDGSNIKGYKILLARMQEEAIGRKKQMGNMLKVIIGLVLAAIIGYAFITGG